MWVRAPPCQPIQTDVQVAQSLKGGTEHVPPGQRWIEAAVDDCPAPRLSQRRSSEVEHRLDKAEVGISRFPVATKITRE